MHSSLARLAVATGVAALTTTLAAPAALAGSSPPPTVRIGALSEAIVGPNGTSEYWLDVTARDRDGVITEITVEWTGDDFSSVVFASRPCFLLPSDPGEPVTMRVPVTLPGPGTYRARVHAHSVESCGGLDEQTGPARQRRFTVALGD